MISMDTLRGIDILLNILIVGLAAGVLPSRLNKGALLGFALNIMIGITSAFIAAGLLLEPGKMRFPWWYVPLDLIIIALYLVSEPWKTKIFGGRNDG